MSGGIESYLPDDHGTRGFVFVVLFLVVMPVVLILAIEAPFVLATAAGLAFLAWLVDRTGVLDDSTDEEAGETDPLTTLQNRYASGEIDEAEFERRLELLVETEERDAGDVAAGAEPDPVRERERER